MVPPPEALNVVGVTSTSEVAHDDHGRGRHSIVLLPHSAWFIAHWVLDSEYVMHIDIATPPREAGAAWVFDDLELDALFLHDGALVVDDEDESAGACAEGLISATERGAALRAVGWLRSEANHGPLMLEGLERLNSNARRTLARL